MRLHSAPRLGNSYKVPPHLPLLCLLAGLARLKHNLQFRVHPLAVRSDHRTERHERRCPNLRGPT